MMKRRYMIPLLILVVLGIAYWAGPRLPRTELNTDLPDLPVGIDRISEYVQDREARLPVKPDNQGIILWGDSVAQPTTYVLLYLHGFTASRFEGQPIISDFVKEFRVNAYLPRLAAHGLQGTEAMLGMTPANPPKLVSRYLACISLPVSIIVFTTSSKETMCRPSVLGIMIA